jgi:2-dehydro-3-deoxyphosphogluconate aldolase/(4S)-4-hydroxy-2-oxoglutarate aldolase
MPTAAPTSLRERVAASVRRAPIIAVVRHADRAEAARQARLFAASGLEAVEITFTVPDAPALVRELLAERRADAAPWIGMGTVTTPTRARAAVAAGAEFIVTPNVDREVATIARDAGLYLVMGALSPSEIVAADAAGADLIKVYPLPPVGGARYLATVRQPLGDVAPMLAGGGFGIEEIPDYRAAGAVAFGVGAPLVGPNDDDSRARIARALELARG